MGCTWPGRGRLISHETCIWAGDVLLVLSKWKKMAGPPPYQSKNRVPTINFQVLWLIVGSLSHYLPGFIHPQWCRIPSINSMLVSGMVTLIGKKRKTPSQSNSPSKIWIGPSERTLEVSCWSYWKLRFFSGSVPWVLWETSYRNSAADACCSSFSWFNSANRTCAWFNSSVLRRGGTFLEGTRMSRI